MHPARDGEGGRGRRDDTVGLRRVSVYSGTDGSVEIESTEWPGAVCLQSICTNLLAQVFIKNVLCLNSVQFSVGTIFNVQKY